MMVYVCPNCEEPAFRMTRKPVTGEPLMASDARHLDGSPVQSGSLIHCDTCKRLIRYLVVQRVREWDEPIRQD